MKLVPKGKYRVGTDSDVGHPIDNETPSIEIEIDAFLMDTTAVSNEMFMEFVNDTGYVTQAEILGRSFVFYLLMDKETIGRSVMNLQWWLDVEGANWKYPFGDEKSYKDLLNHPVVHVTQYDALMYCKWANKRLPTEIEWEVAAKGGTDNLIFPWGNELYESMHRCNVWQGEFPIENTGEDGYIGTAPVDAFYTNDYGLTQMIGNVWEMCSNEARIPLDEIKKETLEMQIETYHKNEFIDYAAKGGSFLCHHSYCNRYRLAARNGIDKLSASSNKGFRCVRDI